MPQPYNYAINLPNPAETVKAAMTGYGFAQQQQAQQAAQQQAAQAAAYEKQKQADIHAAAKDARPYAVAQLAIKYPELSKQFETTYNMLSEEQKKQRIDEATKVYSAIRAGEPQIAQDYLTEQANNYREAGREQEAKTLEDIGKAIGLSPESATVSAGLFLGMALAPR